MLRINLKTSYSKIIKQFIRQYVQITNEQQHDKIRNIGILAHIDAGKTTTTERMLFYSGKTRTLGEVHHGTTVTDFLAQERERGITICSAAVAFEWKDYRINLLDTPGHIDFTMEVEQSLAAIDGCVVILDGSAGVEVQTCTVWQQADHQKLPRLVFVNKMDRADGNFSASVNELKTKLNANPVALQLPIMGTKGLVGIYDILQMKRLTFMNEGHTCKITPLSSDDDSDLFNKIKQKREDIIDFVSGYDDNLADIIIENNNMDNLDNSLIYSAIRRATINQKIVPVLLGSAYKNIGVQPLMDAVINFLPAPSQRNEISDYFDKNDFAGKIFKVTHDKQRGPLCLVRVLNGKLRKGAKIINGQGVNEMVQRIYEPLADEYREISEVSTGNVGILGGLKNTSTGDIILSNMSCLRSAYKKLKKTQSKSNKSNIQIENDEVASDVDDKEDNESHNEEALTMIFGLQPKIPDAVYFCSVEPPSQTYQLALENALKQLQREDPSLRVRYDETTMQTVLGGMGELHLEIIKSRLLTEYKIDADLGELQIAYKESLDEVKARGTINIEKEIAGSKQQVFMDISLVTDGTEIFRLDSSPEATQNLSLVRPRFLNTVRKSAISALDRGPKIGGQIVGTQIILHDLKIGRGTADSFLSAATVQCIQKILINANCRLQEPIMSIQIIAPTDRTSKILSDLGKRRATILDVSTKGTNKFINLLAPLSELNGYSSVVRIISSGGATMSMQPSGYALMNPNEESLAIRRAQGLE